MWKSLKTKPQPAIEKPDKDEYKINGKKVIVEKLNFSDLIDVVFLVLPYIKIIKRVRAEYQSQTDSELFRFMIQTLIEEMDKTALYKAFAIATKLPEDEIKQMSVIDMVTITPGLIRKNGLLDLYLLMKRLGALDG